MSTGKGKGGGEAGVFTGASQECEIVTGTSRRKQRARIAVTETGGEALPVARSEFVGGPPSKTTAAVLHFLVKAAFRRWEAGKVKAHGEEHAVPMSEIMAFLGDGAGKRVRVETVHAALSDSLGTAVRFRYTVKTPDGRFIDRVTEANVVATITMGDESDELRFRLNADVEPLLVDPAYYHLREDDVVAGAPSAYAMVIHDLWMSELRGRTKHEVEYSTNDFANLIGHPFDSAKGPNKAKIQERHVAPALKNTNTHSRLIEVNQKPALTGFVFELTARAPVAAGAPPPGGATLGKSPRRRAAAEWRNSGLGMEGHDLGAWWANYCAYYERLETSVRRRLDTEAKIAYDFVAFVRHSLDRLTKGADAGDPAWVPDSAVLRVSMVYGKKLPQNAHALTWDGAAMTKRKTSERLLCLWHATVREARSTAEWDSGARNLLNDMLDDSGAAFQRVCAIDCAEGWSSLKRVEAGLPCNFDYRAKGAAGVARPHGQTGRGLVKDPDSDEGDAFSRSEIDDIVTRMMEAGDE